MVPDGLSQRPVEPATETEFPSLLVYGIIIITDWVTVLKLE